MRGWLSPDSPPQLNPRLSMLGALRREGEKLFVGLDGGDVNVTGVVTETSRRSLQRSRAPLPADRRPARNASALSRPGRARSRCGRGEQHGSCDSEAALRKGELARSEQTPEASGAPSRPPSRLVADPIRAGAERLARRRLMGAHASASPACVQPPPVVGRPSTIRLCRFTLLNPTSPFRPNLAAPAIELTRRPRREQRRTHRERRLPASGRTDAATCAKDVWSWDQRRMFLGVVSRAR